MPINGPASFCLKLCLLAISACASTETVRTGPGSAAPAAPQPVIAEALPELGSAPGLDRLLMIALDRNPGIQAARARAEAAAEAPAITGWLPDPELLVGWYETPVETRVGPQKWSLGLRQKVPFPTKLGIRSEQSRVEAQRSRVIFERTVRDVLTEVVVTAWELSYLHTALGITSEIDRLLHRYAAAAAAGESSSPISELFRAETQRAQLVSDRVALEELHEMQAERLRALLDLPAAHAVGTPRMPAIPVLAADYPDLLSRAKAHSQELAEAGLAVAAARLRASLAEQRRLPDLTVGVSRIFTDRLDPALGMDPRRNGDDPVIFSAGITLPLWIQRDAAAIRQARALERAAAEDRRAAVSGLRQRLAKGYYRVRNAERLDRLYAEVLLPRSAVAARSAEDLLAAGKGSLASTLETIAVLHNFRLAGARARADRGRAVAELEAAVGRPFEISEGGEK